MPDERILTGPKNSDRVTEKRTEKWTAADERILTGPKNSDREKVPHVTEKRRAGRTAKKRPGRKTGTTAMDNTYRSLV